MYRLVCLWAVASVLASCNGNLCGGPLSGGILGGASFDDGLTGSSLLPASRFGGLQRFVAEEPIVRNVAPSFTASESLPLVSSSSAPSSCGPQPVLPPVLPLRPIILPPVDAPVQVLPAPAAPLPTVVANKCTCSKVVLKPQLFQRLIQVQKNQRFLKKTYKPVVEKIAYCARPRC